MLKFVPVILVLFVVGCTSTLKTSKPLEVARLICMADTSQIRPIEVSIEVLNIKSDEKGRVVDLLKQVVDTDGCLPPMLSSDVTSLSGEGWSHDKPEGKIIVDNLGHKIVAYSVSPFDMSNVKEWQRHTKKRINSIMDSNLKSHTIVDVLVK